MAGETTQIVCFRGRASIAGEGQEGTGDRPGDTADHLTDCRRTGSTALECGFSRSTIAEGPDLRTRVVQIRGSERVPQLEIRRSSRGHQDVPRLTATV